LLSALRAKILGRLASYRFRPTSERAAYYSDMMLGRSLEKRLRRRNSRLPRIPPAEIWEVHEVQHPCRAT
jgi:hypothetical protein